MVDGLTRNVLNGAWKLNRFRFSRCEAKDGQASIGVAREAQDFIRILKENIDDYLLAREQRQSNYEDLFAATAQIVEDQFGVSANPLIARFVETIRNATTHLRGSDDYQSGYELFGNSVAVLADRAAELVQWVIYESLKPVTKPHGMDVISEVTKAVSEVDIFTLNHDLLIENQLRLDNGPSFTDGFSDAPDRRVRWFDWSWSKSEAHVRLFKLHGSINWHCFEEEATGRTRFGCVHGDFDPNNSLDAEEEGTVLKYLKPWFLIGNVFKERAYTLGLFGELYIELCTRLRTCRSIICCGYGWRDKVITARLVQWLEESEKHRIAILHGNEPEGKLEDQFWRSVLDKYIKSGQVKPISKWLCDSSIADLEPYFQD